MKPSALVLCVGAMSGLTAQAQSTVTLSGVIDVMAKYVKADGQPRRLSEGTDGLNSSQLAFKGYEDLGDGLGSGFTLLAGIAPDTGTSASGTKFFNRRSTVSLFSPYGELRVGRDYVPTFWAVNQADVFGSNGLGSGGNVLQLYEGTRQDNSIGYFLPSGLGGVYGQAMVAASEGGTAGDKPTRYIGGRLGYASGPLDLSVGVAQRKFGASANQGSIGLTGANVGAVAVAGDMQRTYIVGGSWRFSAVKLYGWFDRDELRTVKENAAGIGASIPIGVAEIHMGYERSSLKNATAPGSSNAVDQISLGGVYNLSKRTALYGTFSRLDNKDASRLTLLGATGQTLAGGKSQGAEFGLRHFF